MKKYDNIDVELKKEIINYLIDNKNLFNRLNYCTNEFKDYIFYQTGEKKGSYLIGGELIYNFIKDLEGLL